MDLDRGTRPYARHAAEAERASWSVERNIRWLDIDAARAHVTPDVLRQLREAALIQSVHPVNIRRLLEPLWDDVDATGALSIILFEGFKHFHALRTYLEIIGYHPAISDGEVVERRRADAGTGLDPRELIEHLVEFMLSEHLGAHHFHRLAEECEEPVLRELLTLMTADETRHAQCIGDLIAKRVVGDRAMASRVLDAAVHFHHFGDRVVGDFSVVMPANPVAIRAFAKRLESLCGMRVMDQPRAGT
jgi:hypothetical protein